MCNFETLMSFPEPVIKCTAPQGAEFPWFSLISTEFQGIWCFPATCKTRVQHLEQMSHPNYMLYLQLLILKIFLDKKKKGENLRTAKGLFIIFALQIAATL